MKAEDKEYFDSLKRRDRVSQQRVDAEARYRETEALANELKHLLLGGESRETREIRLRRLGVEYAAACAWRPRADIALEPHQTEPHREASKVALEAVKAWEREQLAELDKAAQAAAGRREDRIKELRNLVPKSRVPV
jgi:hypothetical protein